MSTAVLSAPAAGGGDKAKARAGSSTSNAATLRLAADLKELLASPPSGVSASPVHDNLFLWQATLMGPEETPWEGGIYSLRLSFPDQYPDKPPRARFVSQIMHPNVYPDGSLCLDLLQTEWRPTLGVASILTSIQSLLTDPNCQSPANVDAASLYVSDRKEYNRRVRRLAQRSVE